MDMMHAALLELEFRETARRLCTAADVEMGYRIFLGRDPEDRVVIEDAMQHEVGHFIAGIAASDMASCGTGCALPSASATSSVNSSDAPSAAQKDWLLGHLHLPPHSAAVLRVNLPWREWLAILMALPGFPLPPHSGPHVFKKAVPF